MGYGTEFEKISFGANFEFFITPKISFAPSGSFYLPAKVEIGGGDEITAKSWEANGDFHFYPIKNKKAPFYGLVGINYIHVKLEYPPGLAVEDDSGSKVGANFGFGGNFGSGSFQPFFEFKYETINAGQLVLLAGVRYALK